jgi:hypothetical protein
MADARELTIEQAIARLLMDLFVDLAGLFARTDADAASTAVSMLEHRLAARLMQLRERNPEGIAGNEMIQHLVLRLRDVIMQAKAEIAEAARPH